MAEGAEKSEVWQDLKEKNFLEDLSLSPEFVKKFFVTNLVGRTLAHIVGKSDTGAVMVEATPAGELKVAMAGSAIAHNETLGDVDVSDNNWHDRIFTQIVTTVDVLVTGFDGKIRRRPTAGAAWEGEITVPKNSMRSFDCSTQGLQVHNVNAGENPVFEIAGWY